MTKVLIVKEGEWGLLSSERGDYDAWAGLVQRKVSESAEAVTVNSFDDAQTLIGWGGIDKVIFLTRGMIDKARQVKQAYPDIRVVVFTGLYNWEETSGVVVIDKMETEAVMTELSSVGSQVGQ
ncbi:MAG TPA: hypothetical protein VIH52_02965 [Candidatus Nanoarchaeia archaeon]|nr:hypothetical protein [uncultured archaeon]